MIDVRNKEDLKARASQGRNYGQVNPFEGTEYAYLWENNPYKNLYYDSNFWDDIGLSNKAKDANAEYQRLYDEYIAGIYEQQRQDEYNSPASESARMRAAGLNPDLTGLTGQSNTGEFTPPNAGMNPALNGQSPAFNAFSTITSVLGFATSTLQQINAIKGLSFDNSVKEGNMFSSLMDYARPHIVNEYARRFSGKDPHNWSDIVDVSSLGMSRRTSKRYRKAFSDLLSSSQFSSSESAYKQLDANDYAMQHYIQGMTKLSLQSLKAGYNKSISESLLTKWRNSFYQTLYNDFLNGSTLAGLLLIGSEAKFAPALRLNTSRWSNSGWRKDLRGAMKSIDNNWYLGYNL